MKVSGYINGKQKGMGMHFPTDTQRGIQIYEGAGMQIQVYFLKYKQTLFYTHAHTTHTHYLHSEPQDMKQPSETLCEVPIDGH